MDFNYDSKVDASDLKLLSDYVLGKISILDIYFYDDADKDRLCDLLEVSLLKTKPDTDKSNGTTPDNQRTFKQNITESNEILSYINVDDNPYELSIDIVSAGIAEKELSVSFGEFSNCSENEKIIGKSVLLDYNNNLSVDSAKIYFSPRKIEGKISDYMIFEFFPDNNYLLPVETKYTKESAYVETNELGTFCLVNVKDMFQTTSNVSKSSIKSKT